MINLEKFSKRSKYNFANIIHFQKFDKKSKCNHVKAIS